MNSIKYFVYLQFQNKNDFLAQPVEQLTLNQWVRSSILRGVTLNAVFLQENGVFSLMGKTIGKIRVSRKGYQMSQFEEVSIHLSRSS